MAKDMLTRLSLLGIYGISLGIFNSFLTRPSLSHLGYPWPPLATLAFLPSLAFPRNTPPGRSQLCDEIYGNHMHNRSSHQLRTSFQIKTSYTYELYNQTGLREIWLQ